MEERQREMKESERLRREHQEAREQIVVLRAEAANRTCPVSVWQVNQRATEEKRRQQRQDGEPKFHAALRIPCCTM